MSGDFGVILTEDPSVEPVTNTDLFEVLDCAIDELAMAERIAKELGHAGVATRLQTLRDEVHRLSNDLPV